MRFRPECDSAPTARPYCAILKVEIGDLSTDLSRCPSCLAPLAPNSGCFLGHRISEARKDVVVSITINGSKVQLPDDPRVSLLDLLREHLQQSIGFSGSLEGGFLARRRHLQALDVAAEHLEQGKEQLVSAYAGELLAEELRLAQQALSEITGEFTSDDLLGRIFSSFCIGK